MTILLSLALFATNRFEPAERGSHWFAVDSLHIDGHLRPAAGFTLEYNHDALVLFGDGTETADLLQHQMVLHVGASFVVWDRVRFGVSLPVAVWQRGNDLNVNGETLVAPSRAAIGDVRLSADARIVGRGDGPFVLSAGLAFFAPTGDRSQMMSEGVRVWPRLQVAGKISWFVYAANVGFHYRPRSRFAGVEVGSELTAGVGVGIEPTGTGLHVGIEASGRTTLATRIFSRQEQTPLEAYLGASYLFADQFRVGVAGGPGLTMGLATPQFRVMTTFEWVMPWDKPAPASEPVSMPASEPVVVAASLPASEPASTPASEPVVVAVAASEPATEPVPAAAPNIEISGGQLRILKPIQFANGKATILSESDMILTEVAETLKHSPQIKKLRVEGHTDNRGSPKKNLQLSHARAAAVVQWLIAHGVDAERLTSRGWGQQRPLKSNGKEEGRRQNRRVEFHIVEGDAK